MALNTIVARMPHLGDKIFKKVDNQSLVAYKDGNRLSNSLIKEQKLIWIRIIKATIGEVKFHDTSFQFYDAWRNVLKETSIEFVKQVAIATQNFCIKYELLTP